MQETPLPELPSRESVTHTCKRWLMFTDDGSGHDGMLKACTYTKGRSRNGSFRFSP